MFTDAEKVGKHWQVRNAWGHSLQLPRMDTYDGVCLEIGTLGTGAYNFKRKKGDPLKVEVIAQMLGSLRRPLYLVDTRRDGTGAQSSWSPREFATQVATMLSASTTYSFLHLPCMAPSIDLLSNKELPWQKFRDCYCEDLTEEALNVGQAFVEAAAVNNGLVVLLCAEAYRAGFATLAAEEQETCYCHRFSLAHRLAERLRATYHGVVVKRVDLDIMEFLACKQARQDYTPSLVRLTD